MARIFDLRLLGYFVAIAEQRNITRAAERLGIAQPALSQQMRMLEDRFGVQLFERHRSGVTLTRAGLSFLDGARDMLTTSEALATQVRQAARGRHRILKIGLTTSASLHPKASMLLRRVVTRYQDVFVELHDANAQTLTERLIDKDLDVVILRTPIQTSSSLKTVVLDEEPTLVALPTCHRLCKSARRGSPRSVSLKALSADHFILVRRPGQPGIYQQVVDACIDAGFDPQIIAEVPRMILCLNMVAAGIGVSVVPTSMQTVMATHVSFLPCGDLQSVRAPLTLLHRGAKSNSTVEDFIGEAMALT